MLFGILGLFSVRRLQRCIIFTGYTCLQTVQRVELEQQLNMLVVICYAALAAYFSALHSLFVHLTPELPAWPVYRRRGNLTPS